ncbi:FAD-binding domain-containing protein [Dentipellis sp. KUC8613]|nr:FAD-binding domain-containing protein [Dentipellis sp. KUC8613]
MAGRIFAAGKLAALLSLTAVALALPEGPANFERSDGAILSVCKNISSAISSKSDVYYPLSFHYSADIAHWASSSSANAACSVEPGTVEDVGTILQILGSTKTPFAVKGGGHSSNPGFSSTAGVQIAMTRFSQINYDASSQTVALGPGLIWDDVYAALEPHNVNVVGGRVTGVGVAGFTLGGGYSWKTSQYGLTIDTVQAFELVLPNGTVTTVTAADEDLFFGLKGGFNNFGIVTQFTLKTFPQTQVWGGLITITGDQLDKVTAAVAKFSAEVTDPKAAVLPTYNFVLGQTGVSLIMFYDAPTPPSGIFDDFLAIPSFTKDISTRSFSSLVLSSPANATAGSRGLFHSVSVLNYTTSLLNVIVNESMYWGQHLALDSASFISYDVEPFLPSLFSHGAASAYPPDRSRGLLPLNLYFAWGSSLADGDMHQAIIQSADRIRAAAVAEGQDVADAVVYGNYALYDASLQSIYGNNVDRLKSIKATYDPTNVMGLAGGFRF